MADILNHVGRIVPDPELKRFFFRIDHYYSKISPCRNLNNNLAYRRKNTPISYSVPSWIENSVETSVFLSYVE